MSNKVAGECLVCLCQGEIREPWADPPFFCRSDLCAVDLCWCNPALLNICKHEFLILGNDITVVYFLMTLKLTTGALCIPPHANSSVKISHSGPQAEAPRPKTSKIVQTHVCFQTNAESERHPGRTCRVEWFPKAPEAVQKTPASGHGGLCGPSWWWFWHHQEVAVTLLPELVCVAPPTGSLVRSCFPHVRFRVVGTPNE